MAYLVFCYRIQVPSIRLRTSEGRKHVLFTSVTLSVPHALDMNECERDFHLHWYKNCCQEL